MRSRNGFLELLNGKPNNILHSPELGTQLGSQRRGNLLDRYMNGETTVSTNLCVTGSPFNGVLCDYKITFEIVAGSNRLLMNDDSRRSDLNEGGAADNVRSNEMQLSVAVPLGALVNHDQSLTDLGLVRISKTFGSIARLYKMEPFPKLIRQIDFVKCCVFEGFGTADDREVQLAFLGGGLEKPKISYAFQMAESKAARS